jgi:cytochrome c55X
MYRKALALLLWAGLGGTAAFAGTVPPDRQAALNDLLRQDCGSCHGMTLKGGLGPALLPETLAGKSDAFLADTILNGRPATAMPPWRGFLSPDEAAWLVQQLRQRP